MHQSQQWEIHWNLGRSNPTRLQSIAPAIPLVSLFPVSIHAPSNDVNRVALRQTADIHCKFLPHACQTHLPNGKRLLRLRQVIGRSCRWRIVPPLTAAVHRFQTPPRRNMIEDQCRHAIVLLLGSIVSRQRHQNPREPTGFLSAMVESTSGFSGPAVTPTMVLLPTNWILYLSEPQKPSHETLDR